jgi:hypothetical protein
VEADHFFAAVLGEEERGTLAGRLADSLPVVFRGRKGLPPVAGARLEDPFALLPQA